MLFFIRRRISEELLRLIHRDIHQLTHKVGIIMATLAEATAELVALKAQVARNRQEVLDAIAALPPPNASETTPEFDAALAELKATVQAADDDVVPTPV
jgi:NAD(P)H-dependent FMN reductase